MLGKFCGNNTSTINSVISNTNQIHVRFHTDQSKNGRGFQLNFTSIQPSKVEKLYLLIYLAYLYNVLYFRFKVVVAPLILILMDRYLPRALLENIRLIETVFGR